MWWRQWWWWCASSSLAGFKVHYDPLPSLFCTHCVHTYRRCTACKAEHLICWLLTDSVMQSQFQCECERYHRACGRSLTFLTTCHQLQSTQFYLHSSLARVTTLQVQLTALSSDSSCCLFYSLHQTHEMRSIDGLQEVVSLMLSPCAAVAQWGMMVWTANNCDTRYVAVLGRLFTHCGAT